MPSAREPTFKLDDTKLWKVTEGIGLVASLAGKYGEAVSMAMDVVTFLGENFIEEETVEVRAHSVEEVLTTLTTNVDDLQQTLTDMEFNTYQQGVRDLQDELAGVHSFLLELYDFTLNNPGGNRGPAGSGLRADADILVDTAQWCYKAADEYERAVKRIVKADHADQHLTDQDGSQTWADGELIALRDVLVSFLKTSCARYYEAAQHIVDATRKFVQVDADQAADFELAMNQLENGKRRDGSPLIDMSTPDLNGGEPGMGDTAKETDRTNRGDIAPETETSRGPKDNPLDPPRTEPDQGDYVTEQQPGKDKPTPPAPQPETDPGLRDDIPGLRGPREQW